MGLLGARLDKLEFDRKAKQEAEELEAVRLSREAAVKNAELGELIEQDASKLHELGYSVNSNDAGVGIYRSGEEDGMPVLVIGFEPKSKRYLAIKGQDTKAFDDRDEAIGAIGLAIHRLAARYLPRRSIFEETGRDVR